MITRNKFNGIINGKELRDYKTKIDWTDKDFDNRLKKITEIFNLNDMGISDDEFWQEVWDCGVCKVSINTTDARWEETDVSRLLEMMGSYLLYSYNKKEKRKSKETVLNDALSYEDVADDRNYRLAPPDKISESDYKVRELFRGTYEDYVKKVSQTNYDIKSKESWEAIKYNEEEKIKLLKDAKRNLDVLKKQMEKIKNGEVLQFNKEEKIRRIGSTADIGLDVQLERYGLSNQSILDIEEKIKLEFENMSKSEKEKYFRNTNVTLRHLQGNISDVKDYMLSCKLSYTNRVMIKPLKCSTNNNILEKIDYLDPTHVKGMLILGKMKLDPSKDMAIISNDINKKVKEMYSVGQLSDRDIYIIEGIRFNVPHETLGKELGVTANAISKILNRICDNIAKSFYDDHMDWYFLNVSKGKYKKCSKCGEIKLTNQFDKKGKQGLQSRCKSCRKNS